MGQSYIPRELSREIREKMQFLVEPKSKGIFRTDLVDLCKLFCQKIRAKAIEKSAQVHSYKMEHPELIVPFNVPKDKRQIKQGVKCLRNAYAWGEKNFNPEKFDEEFIKNIALRITPKLYSQGFADYRKVGVRVAGARVTPPYPEKLQREMGFFIESLKEQFKCQDIINRIEIAIYAHLHFERIHPFIDGNGRTGRTLQDMILTFNNTPLPIIETGERQTYYNLLGQAIYDWKYEKQSGGITHGATEGERLFYTFMAGKINSSLDKLLNCIGNKL